MAETAAYRSERDYDPADFSWAVPFMRAGYAGRGLTYIVIGGFSLWAIWRGGQASGTSDSLKQLETTGWGSVVLCALAIGLIAYALWRAVDALWDLEDYGSGAKGIVARLGMVVTGLIHGALGIAAFLLLFTSGGGSGDGSKIADVTQKVMSAPFGIWIVGIAGVVTIAAGLYYLKKGITESYRENLRANRFTMNWNWVLKAGVLAQGVVVTIIGGFILYAAITANPNEAGGLGKTFEWLHGQTYGQVLVTALCLGLLGFAVFCFVNAANRIVPKAAGDDTVSVARKIKQQARKATG